MLRLLSVAWICFVLCAAVSKAEEAPKEKPAKLKISGYGFFGDIDLKKMLRVLEPGKKPPQFFDANYLEDAEFLLRARLKQDGYLQPVIKAQVTLQDGREVSYVWEKPLEYPLPRSLSARAVHFKIKEGVLYHFQNLEFSGLEAIPGKKARTYFIETGGIVALKGNRIYSPERFKRGVANLADQLQRMGYQEASVTVETLEIDDRTGAVNVKISVHQGPQFIVRSVRREVFFPDETVPVETRTNHPAKPYSKIWEQDYAQGIRTNYYRRGYPDVTIDFKTIQQTAVSNEVLLDLQALIHTGPRIRVGEVMFAGNKRTRESVLDRQVTLEQGEWLNRLEAEQGRYQLSRLGVFDSVELKYEDSGTNSRNVIYDLKEGKRVDVNLLFGYGSYELLRGGVQLDQYNVFGLAHHQRLKLTQSFKSTSADYTYTMPEPFGRNLDMFFTGSGLRREEVSFTRREYGGSAGLRKFFPSINTDISTRYSYQILEAQDADPSLKDQGEENSRAAAIITDLSHDDRDNPLYPHRGYKIFSTVELASKYLGGNADYQRLEVAGSYHVPLSDSQWLHLGLSHGVVSTLDGTSRDLPFNKRFFPGGENTVRGYPEGEAAPRDSQGDVVGAETYLLGNFEFEQGITPHWSVVTFVDAVDVARELNSYPGDEILISVGGGLRWKTFVGPVRLEYGYNLNRRRYDPTGTIQFSLGFPF